MVSPRLCRRGENGGGGSDGQAWARGELLSPRLTEPDAGGNRCRDGRAISEKGKAERREHGGERAEQLESEPSAACRDDQPQGAAKERPEQPARALRGEIKAEAEPEEPVCGANRAQIGLAGREHPRVVAKKTEPGLGPQRRGDADRLGEDKGDDAPGQCDAQRPRRLSGP